MRGVALRKDKTQASAKVLPAVEADQGYGPLVVLTLGAAVLLCYFLLQSI